jgi:serine/threonine protein phosphatase PrpC
VAREIALGNMTEEQARMDERRNVLLQCVGASDDVYPDMFFGDTHSNAVYMLCSDGFRHEISAEEMYEKLNPNVLLDENQMYTHAGDLIELNKARKERDNISIALVRTF